MLSLNNLEEILSTALKNGGDLAEVFIEESNATTVSCEDNKIEKIISGTDIGAGIRLISNKEVSYIASTDTSYEGLISAAQKIAQSIKGEPKKIKDIVPNIPEQMSSILKRPNLIVLDEKIGMVDILNKTARSFGPKIKQVTVRYSDTNQAVTIANSEGIYIEDNRIRSRYFINVIAEKNGVLQTGYEAPGGSVGFELFDIYPPAEMAGKAAKRAVLMLDAPHAPSGKMMAVLSSEAGGTLIHEACGHSLEADFIMKGTSIFNGKLGKFVASPLITVIDDTTLPQKFGSAAFDDEGTPAQKTILIENGILKGFLSDWYTARELGIKSSGNGRRESFRTKPVPRMTNTMIASGHSDPQEIIDSVKNGILVIRIGGGEVNVANGDFVFEINEGYLIENGKVTHPVRGAILTGNGPRVLETIDMVGSDLGFQVGICGKYDHVPVSDAQPTIRIPQIVVGGR
ncbi:TldD/PmbA family protein [Candidatus Saganbacteria bacterium]|nr:TldD/PmbA family protein [Candidatus Saganbacteria bacterium]